MIDGLRDGKHCGVPNNRQGACLRLANLTNDNRLAGVQGLFGHVLELLWRLHVFQQQQENVGLIFVEHVIYKVENFERRFIAGSDYMAEGKVAWARPVEKGK